MIDFQFKPEIVTVGRDTSNMSHEEWQDYRQALKTLGGSDIGAALGLSKYTSPQELFYKKLGLYQKNFGYRMSVALGNSFEPTLRNMMKYHDFDDEVFAENIDRKTEIHEVAEFGCTLFPKKYPMLHHHLDGLIQYQGMAGTGHLELKWMSDFVRDMWADGIEPSYLAQTILNAHAPGLDYGVLGIFTGNHNVDVFVIEKNDDLFNSWVPILEDFWARFTEADKLIQEARDNDPSVPDEHLYQIVGYLEPEVVEENMAPYVDFMSERAKMLQHEEVIIGSNEDFNMLAKYKDHHKQELSAKAKKGEIKAYFIQRLADEEAGKIDMEDEGSVTNRKTVRINMKK